LQAVDEAAVATLPHGDPGHEARRRAGDDAPLVSRDGERVDVSRRHCTGIVGLAAHGATEAGRVVTRWRLRGIRAVAEEAAVDPDSCLLGALFAVFEK